ncbi:MAG TPA: ABC transporter substrate-binding protein [Terriglobales bacterium]|nr:ABC transporter substrate-binding protein [Terriglobales bacterium]
MSEFPQRIVSLQPSVSVTLRDLGLLGRVVACTKYCVDVVPELAGSGRLIVHDSWTAQSDQILAAKPDLVIASVPYQEKAVGEILRAGLPFLGLSPRSLADVYRDITMIASVAGATERAEQVVSNMRSQIECVREKSAGPSVSVYCEEWGKPLIHSQPWVAELVEAAGGKFLGTPGKQTDAETIRRSEPEVIIAAWCGAGDRVPLEKIIKDRNWQDTPAAKHGRVYCVQDEFLNTPASTLIAGLHAVAYAIHPDRFAQPTGIRRIRCD